MNKNSSLVRFLAVAGAAALTMTSCTQYQQQGAAVGALGGAAIGAIAGDGSDDVVRGAAIGAAAGAGAAALKEEHDRRQDPYAPNDPYGSPEPLPAPEPAAPASKYPTATRSDNPNLVISPYKPHNVIDVTGFKSGQLAKDPSNNRIFVIP